MSNPRKGRSTNGLRYLAVAVATAIVVAPVAVAASDRFVDVPDSHIFHNDIRWLADAGVTAGCGADVFCPESNVTRGQMAAFMRRLATSKVVDAATAVTAETADEATVAQAAERSTWADVAGNALSADTAESATTAETADIATTALDSERLGGRLAWTFQPRGAKWASIATFDVQSNGTHPVATVVVRPENVCQPTQELSTEYVLSASGYTNNVNDGESVELMLRIDGVTFLNSTQKLFSNNGTFHLQVLRGVPGTEEVTVDLLVKEGEGDLYTLQWTNLIAQPVGAYCLSPVLPGS